MLEQKDLHSIGELLDKKLKTQEESITKKFDNKLDEVLGAVNDGFTDMQKEFDGVKEELSGVKEELSGVKEELSGVKEEVKLRPTLKQIMNWGDKKIVELELKTDRHDYLHINELDKLPPQAEISRALVERGLKKPA